MHPPMRLDQGHKNHWHKCLARLKLARNTTLQSQPWKNLDWTSLLMRSWKLHQKVVMKTSPHPVRLILADSLEVVTRTPQKRLQHPVTLRLIPASCLMVVARTVRVFRIQKRSQHPVTLQLIPAGCLKVVTRTDRVFRIQKRLQHPETLRLIPAGCLKVLTRT